MKGDERRGEKREKNARKVVEPSTSTFLACFTPPASALDRYMCVKDRKRGTRCVWVCVCVGGWVGGKGCLDAGDLNID